MLTLPDFQERQCLLLFTGEGDKLSFKNDNILITAKDGKVIHQSTCYRLFCVFIIGHISITSGLLQRARKFGFSIILLSYGLKYYGSFFSRTEGNVLLREKQYSYKGLEIAKHLLENKMLTQIQNLQKIRNKTEYLKQNIEILQSYRQDLANLQGYCLNDLLGREGVFSRIYFQNIFKDYNWKGRFPRAKTDIINCLLDIGYTILFNFIEAIAGIYGFDVYKGVYHTEFYQRKSLICDLIEPFRVIIDHALRKAYNLGQIKKEDFSCYQNKFTVFGEKAKPYTVIFLKEILANKKDIFVYLQQYYRCFIRCKDIKEYPVYDFYKGG